MLGFFKHKKEKERMIEESKRSFDEIWNADFDKIWSLTDTNDFVIALYSYLCRKSDCGEKTQTLSPHEKVFFVCRCLEDEVNNGGFSQFFYNSSGSFSNEAEASLRAIGANKTADICRKAAACFGKNIPADREEREIFLENNENEETDRILNECDEMFYEYPDNLELLAYNYAIKNRENFTR